MWAAAFAALHKRMKEEKQFPMDRHLPQLVSHNFSQWVMVAIESMLSAPELV